MASRNPSNARNFHSSENALTNIAQGHLMPTTTLAEEMSQYNDFNEPPHPPYNPDEPGPQALYRSSAHSGMDLYSQLDLYFYDLGDHALNEEFEVVILRSNTSPHTRGAANPGVIKFLLRWAGEKGVHKSGAQKPLPAWEKVRDLAAKVSRRSHVLEDIKGISYYELDGEKFDFQGLDWETLGTSREIARKERKRTFNNCFNQRGPHNFGILEKKNLPKHRKFFEFRRTIIKRDVHIAHEQLRQVFRCPTRTTAFYPSEGVINRLNLVTGESAPFINLAKVLDGGVVSTIDAKYGLLVAGTLGGHYAIQRYDYDDEVEVNPTGFRHGRVSPVGHGITNYVGLYKPRGSHRPYLATAGNDRFLKLMDVETQQVVSEWRYSVAPNHSVVCPDGSARLIVGDNRQLTIVDEKNGKVIAAVDAHADYGFACDWCPGTTIFATAGQDRTIKVWDARQIRTKSGQSTPLHSWTSEMCATRSLRFSSPGDGPPVLLAAEGADYLNIIDAKTFESKQTFDIFGEIAGAEFSDGSQVVNLLSGDMHRGGLFQFNRCGFELEPWGRTDIPVGGVPVGDTSDGYVSDEEYFSDAGDSVADDSEPADLVGDLPDIDLFDPDPMDYEDDEEEEDQSNRHHVSLLSRMQSA